MNYYRRYIGDYQRDTMHLSLVEHGAFTMLLDSYYAQDGNLPETHWVLCRLCRAMTQDELDAVGKMADEFFPLVDGRRRNARADRELSIATTRIHSAKSNGQLGGRPKKITENKPNGLFSGSIPVNPNITHGETHLETSPTTNHHIKRHSSKPAKTALPENWVPTEATVKRLTEQFKFANGDAQKYLDAFRDACRAKGYEYVNFDAAFSNCVRQDWPKFRNGAPTMPKNTDPHRPNWS